MTIASNTDNGLERAYLTDLAEQKGIELDIRTLVNETEVVQFYNRATILAYAPILEPLGLVALEAMACCLPVVGVREGGVRETVIDGVTGVIAERDEEQFAEAMLRMISEPDLREQIGTAARKYVVQNWTWESSTCQIEHMLEQAANKHVSIAANLSAK